MRVLIACEFSGIVCDEFLKLGHDAWSCDLLPSETDGPHYQGPVQEILDKGWDLMIAHPPCTHLAVSGAPHMMDLISEVYVSDTPHAAGQNTFQNCTVGTYAPETKTLRDEFAMTVMGSLLYNRGETGTFSDYAQDAYEYADCMMEARKK
jgi:hypothetical protein